MTHAPSTSAANGRDATTGRFTAGNAFARGNPFALKMAALRAALLQTITTDDVQAAARMLVQMARDGDLAAIKELLDRTIGKAPAAVELSGKDGAPLGGTAPHVTGIVL